MGCQWEQGDGGERGGIDARGERHEDARPRRKLNVPEVDRGASERTDGLLG